MNPAITVRWPLRYGSTSRGGITFCIGIPRWTGRVGSSPWDTSLPGIGTSVQSRRIPYLEISSQPLRHGGSAPRFPARPPAGPPPAPTSCPVQFAAAVGASAQPFGYGHLTPNQKRHVSGLMSVELGGASLRAAAPTAPAATSFSPVTPSACDVNLGTNIKVNQNCLNI